MPNFSTWSKLTKLHIHRFISIKGTCLYQFLPLKTPAIAGINLPKFHQTHFWPEKLLRATMSSTVNHSIQNQLHSLHLLLPFLSITRTHQMVLNRERKSSLNQLFDEILNESFNQHSSYELSWDSTSLVRNSWRTKGFDHSEASWGNWERSLLFGSRWFDLKLSFDARTASHGEEQPTTHLKMITRASLNGFRSFKVLKHRDEIKNRTTSRIQAKMQQNGELILRIEERVKWVQIWEQIGSKTHQ